MSYKFIPTKHKKFLLLQSDPLQIEYQLVDTIFVISSYFQVTQQERLILLQRYVIKICFSMHESLFIILSINHLCIIHIKGLRLHGIIDVSTANIFMTMKSNYSGPNGCRRFFALFLLFDHGIVFRKDDKRFKSTNPVKMSYTFYQ